MARIISYAKFMELVPERTKKYVQELLPYVRKYIEKNNGIPIRGREATAYGRHLPSAVLAANFLEAHGNEKSKAALIDADYNSRKIRLEDKQYSVSDEQIFTDNSGFFCICDEEKDYLTLTPELIAKCHIYNFTNNNNHSYEAGYLFSSNDKMRKLAEKLGNIAEEEKKQITYEMKSKFYSDLNIETISFLETVAKVHAIVSHNAKNSNAISKKLETDADISIVSILIALNYHPNLSTIWFGNNGVKQEKIFEYINFKISKSQIDGKEFDITILKEYYSNLIFGGQNKDTEVSQIDIDSIVENIFNRETNNNSLVFERIMLYCDTKKDYSDYVKELSTLLSNAEASEKQTKMKKFYAELSDDVISYIETVAKIYAILIRKMAEGKHNVEVLTNADDVDTLSLLLASYFVPNKVNGFFADNNITLERIFAYLKINITKEEIAAEPFDIDILVNSFNHFIHGGINEKKPANQITVDSVAKNMTDREFNKTRIIGNLYYNLCGIALPSNFLSDLDEYIAKKDLKEKKKKEKEFFDGMPAQSITYLYLASRIYQYINSVKPNTYAPKDVATVSLIIALDFGRFGEYDVYNKFGVQTGKIANYLDIAISKAKIDYLEDNIDVLALQFKDVVAPTEKTNKRDLTVTELAKNILTSEAADTILVRQMLESLNTNASDFKDFDNILNQINIDKKEERERQEKEKQEELQKAAKTREEQQKRIALREFFEYLPDTTTEFVETATKIYKKICNKAKATDMTALSILISLYLVPNAERKFFEKKGITLDSILETAELTPADIIAYEYEEVDIDTLKKNFENYVFSTDEHPKHINIDDLALKLFNPEFTQSTVISSLVASNAVKVGLLKEELRTGHEIIEPKTEAEMLDDFKALEISPLENFRMNSISNFGNELTVHSEFISEAYSKISSADNSGTLSDITPLLDGVVVVEKVEPKNFFARIFGNNNTEEKVSIDSDAIKKVQYALKDKAEALNNYVGGFEFICDYILISLSKNQQVLGMLQGYKQSVLEARAKLEGTNNEEAMLKYNGVAEALDARIKFFFEANAAQKAQYALLYTATKDFVGQVQTLRSSASNMLPLLEMNNSVTSTQLQQQELLAQTGKATIDLVKSSLQENESKRQEKMLELNKLLSESTYQQLSGEIMHRQIALSTPEENPGTIGTTSGLNPFTDFEVIPITPDDKVVLKLD